MDAKFERAYAALNDAQKQAVDTIDGPVLVIAGPGTGKTQLLTTRIANILAKTDVSAANILCLTFTESGAQTMRDRLSNFIGQAAYDVTISTYHAFGSDLIRRFPDYFSELADTRPVDDLGADAIFRGIVDALPYNNPLKYADNYLGDIRGLVSDAKRALLTPSDLRGIAKQNLSFISKTTPLVRKQLAGMKRIDKKSVGLFEELLNALITSDSRVAPRGTAPNNESGAAPALSFLGADKATGPATSSLKVGGPVAQLRDRAPSLSEPFPRGGLTAEPRVSSDQPPAALRLSSSEEGAPPRKSEGGLNHNIEPLGTMFSKSLAEALEAFNETGKTTAITAWKNQWLAKDESGGFIVDGEKANRKLEAAAAIYEKYLALLKQNKLFDYDDMILRAVNALETHADLRYTLQEQYLYILLDEFQDTNGAQLRLVELLTDNPVHEGRPNVLAVGDDDQAIYAFQGADYSHMLQFQQMYRDVLLVPLTKNYRSHQAILEVARGVAEQIEERLHHHFPSIEKLLTAENTSLPKQAIIERREARSDIEQFEWTAGQIRALIDGGMPASSIAVLAPQHKYLEPLVAFLHQRKVPVRYEKRENILDDPGITQLLRMSDLCLALKRGDHASANSLWAEVLSFAFWELPTSLIWQISWQANDQHMSWTDTLLATDQLRPIALFFIRLSMILGNETVETMLDYLIGVQALDLQEPDVPSFCSPFYAFYFGELITSDSGVAPLGGPPVPAASARTMGESAVTGPPASVSTWGPVASSAPKNEIGGAAPISFLGAAPRGATPQRSGGDKGNFWNLLTNLIILRARLREYKALENEPLTLIDFVTFAEAHRAADIKILNTSPYQEADEAVQLLTAFKAKGQEYTAVFILAVNDEAWGTKSRGQSSRLSIPPNLQFIRYAGATNDERLRLFYVALTRAKTHLYLINYVRTYGGKTLSRLKYLNETTDESGEALSPLLPEKVRHVLPAHAEATSPSTELAAYWQQRHEQALSRHDLQQLLSSRLKQFQLSATHVGDFTDVVHAGPEAFFLKTVLRFPQAPSPELQFGNAMHETLEWIHSVVKRKGELPSEKQVLLTFEQRLRAKRLSEQRAVLLLGRGVDALRAYLAQRRHTIDPGAHSEFNFRGEGVFVDDAHLGGKIDKLIVDKEAKTITIVDYKTGRAHSRWTREVKLHKYEQQLYFYKLLVEGSHTFAGYTVTDAYLEFVEPDEQGNITELHIQFDEAKMEGLKQLIRIIWRRVKLLDLPDISEYSTDLAGVEAFEAFLLENE